MPPESRDAAPQTRSPSAAPQPRPQSVAPSRVPSAARRTVGDRQSEPTARTESPRPQIRASEPRPAVAAPHFGPCPVRLLRHPSCAPSRAIPSGSARAGRAAARIRTCSPRGTAQPDTRKLHDTPRGGKRSDARAARDRQSRERRRTRLRRRPPACDVRRPWRRQVLTR